MSATDPVTDAATEGSRASRADCFKAFLAAIEEHDPEQGGQLPAGFGLTDHSLALLANCALDLDPEDATDGEYVKRFRQRERNRRR